jgi:hypothetical protein
MIWLIFACVGNKPIQESSCEEPETGTSLRRLTAVEYQNSINELTGVLVPEELLPPTSRSKSPRTWAINNTLGHIDLENLLHIGKHVSGNINWQTHLTCSPSAIDIPCAETFLIDLATKAFRRPPSTEEEEIITKGLHSGIPIEQALEVGLQIILQSPQFLYLDNSSTLHLLSLFFRQNPPSDNMLQELSNASADEITRYLLEDPLLIHTLISFHEDWLQLFHLDQTTKISDYYSEQFKQDFLLETNLFISDILWHKNPTFASLLLDTTAWVSPSLRDMYLVPQITDWTLMDLGENRPGILSRGAFLNSHAYAEQTAPVRRGNYILQELLCVELTPPADVNMTLQSEGTVQEQLDEHASNPTCSGCHNQIDPLGIAFEQFDHIGFWRNNWPNNEPIPSTGTILNTEYSSLYEMLSLIANSSEGQACYAKKWVEYAIARPLQTTDDCFLEEIQEEFIKSNGNIRQLLYSIATSPILIGENNEH